MTRVAALLVALLIPLAAAACGGNETTAQAPPDEPVPGTTGDTGAPAGTTAPGGSAETGENETSVLVYLTRGDELGVVRRTVPATSAVGRVALEELLAGPRSDEAAIGFTTQIPVGTTLLGLDVAGGTATVDLSAEFAQGGGSATMVARLAQVVHTLTQFPTVDGVLFELDGQPVTTFSSEGIVLDGPQSREDYEDVAPAILVESPAPFETVASPLRIEGTANVFEATVSYALVDALGNELASGFATATCGTGCRGAFEAEVPFAAAEGGALTLSVFEVSAKDGTRANVVEIPLQAG